MKKVLAAVVAAAMALSMSVSAFAATWTARYPLDATKGYDNTLSVAPDVGETTVAWDNANPTVIAATADHDFHYTVTMTGNLWQDEKAWETAMATDAATGGGANAAYTAFAADADVFNINYWNFEPSISVKGPAEVQNARIDGDSFKYNLDGSLNKLTVQFDVTFNLLATNEDSTDLKGVVVTYGVKTVDVPRRSGFKGAKEKTEEGVLAVGYTNEDIDDLYDEVVVAFDDMRDYEEDSFEVALDSNPVIPSSVIRFLQKNLKNTESVIFVKDDEGDSVYFDSTTTLELTGKAMDEFSATNHANIKVNDNGVDEISDVLDEAGVDYKWFNYVVARDITGIHSFDSTYDDPYVYLVDAEGALTEIDLIDYDFGDVAFEGPMGQYIITEGAIPAELFVEEEPVEEPIEDDDIIDEPVEDDDVLVDEDGNAIEDNPGTGSSNAISVAVAMAVVSLAAAGVVASKKASK